MLRSLYIENIAVIEKAELELKHGLNVLTGETGAGKSIIIDSINAVLGERTSRDIIRDGCKKGMVSAVFCDINPETLKFLEKMDITPDDDGNIIISRALSLDGKNNCKINGRTVSTSVLKDTGRTLINIHGQHDNQSLLDPGTHYTYLDAVAENKDLVENYRQAYNEYKKVLKELKKETISESERLQKVEILEYQIKDIESANITSGEFSKLNDRRKILANIEKINSSVLLAKESLNGDEGALMRIKNSSKNLSNVSENIADLGKLSEKLLEISFELEGIIGEIDKFSEENEYSPYEMAEIENRLDLLHHVMRKYGDTEEKILEFLANAKNEVSSLVNFEKKQAELSLLSDKCQEELVCAAEKLSNSRRAAAKLLSKNVCEVLRFLDMSDVILEIDIKNDIYNATGNDTVEFLISANKGASLKPLNKIASGGELSRVMLAIKSVLSEKDNLDTMIFDEIDSGISGRAAQKIAVQLCKVARSRQVICVTHLAQIASAADNHLLIEKHSDDKETFTSVLQITGDERIREVARIMSGSSITENLYISAKEMIESFNH